MRDAARCAVLVLSASVAGCGMTHGLTRSAPPAGPPEEAPAAGAQAAVPEVRTISGDLTAVSPDVAGLVCAVGVHAREVG